MNFESVQSEQKLGESINPESINNSEKNLEVQENYNQSLKDKIKVLQNRQEDIIKQNKAFRDSSGPAGVDSPLLKALEDEIESLTKELKNGEIESESDDFEAQKNKLFSVINKMDGVYSETLDKDYDVDEIEGIIVAVIMGEADVNTIPRAVVYGSEKNLREQVKELIELRKSELN